MSGSETTPRTLGAILAGGRAQRLGGGDKMLRLVGGRSILARQIERLTPQVMQLVISANDDPARFAAQELPVIADTIPDRAGPLAGVLAVLDWAAARDIAWVATVPGDAPFLPRDLVARLHAARTGATIACAGSNGRTHPVIALWPVSLRAALRHALTEQGIRRVGGFIEGYACAVVEWDAAPADPFFNVNTPEDLREAEQLVKEPSFSEEKEAKRLL